MNGFQRSLILILCLQLVTPTTLWAGRTTSADEIAEQFHTKLNAFIGHYKQIHKITEVSPAQIRAQLDKDRFRQTYESWNMDEGKKVTGEPDPLVATREQRRLNRVNAPLIREAQIIADIIYSDSLIARTRGQKPNVDQFNAYMFELYAMYIDEPQSRQALDLFFQVLGERHFSQADLVEMQKNRSFLSQATRPFTWNAWVTMGAVTALVFAKKWPKTDKLMKMVSSRFNLFAHSRQAIAARPTQQAARSAGRFATDPAAPRTSWYRKAVNGVRQIPRLLRGRRAAPAPARTAPAPAVAVAPPVVKNVAQVMTEQTAATTRTLTENLKNVKTPAEIRQIADSNLRLIQTLKISDWRVLEATMVGVTNKSVRSARALEAHEVGAIYNDAKIIARMAATPAPVVAAAPTAPAPTVVAALATPVTAQSRAAAARSLATRTLWSLPEMSLIGFTKLFGRQREPWKYLRDTARFFNIPYRVGTAYGLVATGVYHLPNTQYTLIPEDELTHGVNAMAILSVACKADELNAKTLALANQVNADVALETVNEEFAKLVAEMKSLANEYTLTMRMAGMYTNDIPDVYTLPTVGIQQDRNTGKIIYTRKNEAPLGLADDYRIAVNCPTRKGSPIRTVNWKEADRKVRLAVDRLALIELLNDLSEAVVATQLAQLVQRMMDLNVSAYNTGIEMMMERLPREGYLQTLFDALDARLNGDTTRTISGNRNRVRAAAYKAQRLNHMNAANQ